MEPDKNKKLTDCKEIRMKLLYTIMCLFPIISATPIIFCSEKIAKLTNITSAQVKDVGILLILLIEIIFTGLALKDTEEYESSKPNKKDYANCIEIEIQGRKHYITQELYNRLGKRGVPTLGEVLSLPPKTKRTSQVPTDIQHFIKDKENTTSRTTPFPTKQVKTKSKSKETVQEIWEKHERNMADLDYIESEITKHNYPITKELEIILRTKDINYRKEFDDYINRHYPKEINQPMKKESTSGFLKTETTCTNEFENYIHNNPPKGFTVETFDLTKDANPTSEAPGVNPVLSDLINQIQTHGDNIVVKQQGQQLTIKATLNQNNQNKTDQWGDF